MILPKNKSIIHEVNNMIASYCDQNFNWDFDPSNPIVRLHEPTFGADEINAAVNQMLSTQVTMGKKVREFEENFVNKLNYKYGVMSNSGSSANLLAIATLANHTTLNRLKVGDEVIVPALSRATTVWPIIQHGLIPVIVDCDYKTFNFDIAKLEKSISNKTKAIMLVHVYGNPCDMDNIMKIVNEKNLYLIEDSCESMGSSYKGRTVGSFGDMGTFSFYYSHHITTFEGGITVTNNFDYSETLRVLRAHGWSREADEREKYNLLHSEIDPRFIFINLGYNLRPTEIQAVIGNSQLNKLDNIIEKRRSTYENYRKRLNKYSDIFDFQEEQINGKSSWFGFSIIIKESSKIIPKDIIKHLNLYNIETRPIIAGNIKRHPVMKYYDHKVICNLDNSDRIMNSGFAIGCHHHINEEAVDYVCSAIDKYINNNYR